MSSREGLGGRVSPGSVRFVVAPADSGTEGPLPRLGGVTVVIPWGGPGAVSSSVEAPLLLLSRIADRAFLGNGVNDRAGDAKDLHIEDRQAPAPLLLFDSECE